MKQTYSFKVNKKDMEFKCHNRVFLSSLKCKIFNPLPHAGKFKCL